MWRGRAHNKVKTLSFEGFEWVLVTGDRIRCPLPEYPPHPQTPPHLPPTRTPHVVHPRPPHACRCTGLLQHMAQIDGILEGCPQLDTRAVPVTIGQDTVLPMAVCITQLLEPNPGAPLPCCAVQRVAVAASLVWALPVIDGARERERERARVRARAREGVGVGWGLGGGREGGMGWDGLTRH